MKKLFILALALPAALVVFSCASTEPASGGVFGDDGISEIVITNEGDKEERFYINDNKGKQIFPKPKILEFVTLHIKPGETITVTLPNGSYEIQGSFSSAGNDNTTGPLNNEQAVYVIKSGNYLTKVDVEGNEARAARLDAAAAFAREAAEAVAGQLEDAKAASKALAVFPVRDSDAVEGGVMQENIIISLINTQKYTVIEKQRLDELLAEYDFQNSGLVGEESMTLGKFLEVDAVIIGNMSGEGASRRLALQVVDVNSYKTLAGVSQYLLAENAVPAAPAQTLLPLAGGTADERTIFASFMIELGSFADGSGDSALAPKGRTWDMWTGAGLETVFNLGKGRGMSDAILVNIEKTGQRNQAIAARVDIANRSRVAVSTLEYYDPIELWLKMPRLVDQLKTPRQQFSDYDTYTSTSSYRYFAEKDQTPVFAMYRPGVNRAETEPLIQRLLQESQLLFETGIFDKVYLLDRTKDYEAAITAKNLSATWEQNYAQIRKWKLKNGIKSPTADDYTETRAIFAFNGELDTAAANMKFDENLLIEVTRQGNRTRLELLRGNASLLPGSDPKYTVLALDYSSPADFNLKLRTFSQAVIQIFQQEDTVVSIGVQGYDPSVRRQGGTVPADLVEIKRDGAQGNMPLRGFHMGKYEVTQKEFEGLMGYNPATVKSANLPVDNISLIDAAGYCNALSLRDGLEPAYYILDRREVGSAERLRIVRNDEANGYRMPFDDEWNFAAVDELSSIRSTDVSSILSVEELREEYGWFEGNSGGSLHPVGQKAPNQFGLYDMWGNVDEWAHDDRTAKLAEEGRNILKGGNYRTPPDLAALDDDLTNADKDKGNVRNYVGATFPVITDGKAKFERKSIYLEAIPGIRVVRPVFDFWKFTGDSGQ